MKSSQQTRKAWLLAILLAAAAVHLVAPMEEAGEPKAVGTPVQDSVAPALLTLDQARAASGAAVQAGGAVSGAEAAPQSPREADLRLLGDLQEKSPFRSHSWYVPPPPPPSPPPPPPPMPTAPPLSFVYMGRMEANNGTVVYLAQGERLLSVRAGELIDQIYKIERIDADFVYFIYLPLDTRQTLAAGR